MSRNFGNRLFLLFCFLLLSAGLGIMAYPTVSNWLVEYDARVEISGYNTAVEEKDASVRMEMIDEAAQYNDILKDPAKKTSMVSYNDLLAVTDAIGYLEIPKLHIYLPIYHGVEEDVLEKGIGHLPESSLPIGGESTHCVLSGHSGLPTAKILTELDKLETGDMFYLHVMDQVLAYQVDQIKVVLPEETEDIRIVEGQDYVTLVTCVPYGINTHRLLVRGSRTEYTPGQILLQPPAEEAPVETIPADDLRKYLIAAVGAVWLLIILLILFVPARKRKGRED